MTTRRSFITGLISFVAAPAIVRVSSLMPVKVMDGPYLTKLEIINLALQRVSVPPRIYAHTDIVAWRVPFVQHWHELAGAIIAEMPFTTATDTPRTSST